MNLRSALNAAGIGSVLFLAAAGLFAEAYSVPTSTRLVRGEISLPNGETVRFAVLEGQMLKLRDTEAGYFLGFSPTIVDEASLAVRFAVFEITERGRDLHSLRHVGSADVARSGWLEKAHADVEITGIGESGLSVADLHAIQAEMAVPSKARTADLAQFPNKPATIDDVPYKDGCCVTCGTTTVCGCAVEMACGNCCTGACCGGGGGPTTGEGEGPANDDP